MDGNSVIAVLRLVAGLVVAGGVYLVAHGWRRVSRARESRGWPQIEGEVIAVEVARGQQFDGSLVFEPAGSIEKLAVTSTLGHSAARSVYVPRVQYRYQVEGVEHEGTSIFVGDANVGHPPKVAARYLEPYKVGSRVPVFYRPVDPAVAVLEPGLRARNAIVFVMGIVTLLFGGLLSLIAWSIPGA